jgi:hypothetical protein
VSGAYGEPEAPMMDAPTWRPSGLGAATGGNIERELPTPPEARAALVTQWQDKIRRDRKKWEPIFKRMREDAEFVREGAEKEWVGLDKYIVNIMLRHTASKVASLYARNPSVKVKRRERLMYSLWDGTIESLQAAAMDIANPASQAILMDAQRLAKRGAMLDGLARTMELVLEHQISQQRPGFKKMMKHVVRRAVVKGVGFVKPGFVREGTWERSPDAMERTADFASVEGTMQRLSADIADGETAKDDADAERLRLTMAGAQAAKFITTHEGLTFDYPDPCAIIPHSAMTALDGFQGCDHVTEEFLMSNEKVKDYFGIEPGALKGRCTRYRTGDNGPIIAAGDDERDPVCVWMTYCKTDGLVYWTLDGWPDFLKEPSPPDVRLERFWPWFSLVFNETEDAKNPYPPSDIYLLRHPQKERNRSREALREHRIANRPKYLASEQVEDEDLTNITQGKAHSVTRVKGLGPNQKVSDLVEALKHAPIDAALYDTNPVTEDILQASGSQEANLGGTSGGTATEVSVAENSRMSGTESNKDDLDMLLSELFGEAGQICLREMSMETVARIVGEGAVWPELSADDIAEEVYTTILAGSSGKPNRAAELQNFERMMPFLVQIPGVNPIWLARQAIERLDDGIDISEAIAAGMPSIAAMNAQMSKPQGSEGGGGPAQGGDGKNRPDAQGAQGASNAPRPGGTDGAQPPQRPGLGSGQAPMTGAPSGM